MNFHPRAIFSEFRFAFFSQLFPYNVNQLANKRNLDPRETTQRWVNFLASAVYLTSDGNLRLISHAKILLSDQTNFV